MICILFIYIYIYIIWTFKSKIYQNLYISQNVLDKYFFSTI